jgi:hypothetical protein
MFLKVTYTSLLQALQGGVQVGGPIAVVKTGLCLSYKASVVEIINANELDT